MTKPLNIIFAGTPAFAAESLKVLLNEHHHIVAVYTQPDRPAGRGRKLSASPVKQAAIDKGIPVFQPLSLKPVDVQDQLRELGADIMIVVAYGLILPQAVLDIPKYGCLNVHASLLPRWRGAAPIERAIAAGDTISGITIMQMEAGLDTGPMLVTEECSISPTLTGGQLHDQLAVLGGRCLVQCLKLLPTLTPQIQDSSQATYAHKLSKTDRIIHWQSSTRDIHNLIRAFNPTNVTTTTIEQEICRVLAAEPLNTFVKTSHHSPGTIINATKQGIDVATGDGVLRLTQLQLPGAKVLDIQSLLNSKKSLFQPGKQFTSSLVEPLHAPGPAHE